MSVPSGDQDGSNSGSAAPPTIRDWPSASDIIRMRRTLPVAATRIDDPRSHPIGFSFGASVTVSRRDPSAPATTHRRDVPASRYIKVVPSGDNPGDKPRAFATVVTAPPE